VEHVGVRLEGQKITHDSLLLDTEKLVEVASACRSILPLLEVACVGVAVVVDTSSVARDDSNTVITITINVCDQRPVGVIRVPGHRTGVITDSVVKTSIQPGLESISVVETSDLRGHKTLARIVASLINTNLLQPVLIELNLAISISIGDVILVEMGKCVRDVAELIAVGRDGEPLGKRITRAEGAVGLPLILLGPGWPLVDAGVDRFLDLMGRVRQVLVVDSFLGNTDQVTSGAKGSVHDVAVTIVGHLQSEARARRKTSGEILLPGDVMLDIGHSNLGLDGRGLVHASGQHDVVNLSEDMSLALAEEETSGHPVDVAMLKVAGGQRPFRSPAQEPDELFTTAEVVDDSSDGTIDEAAACAKLGNDLGSSGVGNGSGNVVKTLGSDTGVAETLLLEHNLPHTGKEGYLHLDIGSSEVADIGEVDRLIDTSVTASTTDGHSARARAGVLVDADHTNVEVSLVVVNSRPLLRGDGAAPTFGILIRYGVENNDTTIVAGGTGRVQDRQLNAGGRHKEILEGDTVGQETKATQLSGDEILSNDKNLAVNGGRGESRCGADTAAGDWSGARDGGRARNRSAATDRSAARDGSATGGGSCA
jgi:hypothetical protein